MVEIAAIERRCPICDAAVHGRSPRAIYCSTSCSDRASARRRREGTPAAPIASASLGAPLRPKEVERELADIEARLTRMRQKALADRWPGREVWALRIRAAARERSALLSHQ